MYSRGFKFRRIFCICLKKKKKQTKGLGIKQLASVIAFFVARGIILHPELRPGLLLSDGDLLASEVEVFLCNPEVFCFPKALPVEYRSKQCWG